MGSWETGALGGAGEAGHAPAGQPKVEDPTSGEAGARGVALAPLPVVLDLERGHLVLTGSLTVPGLPSALGPGFACWEEMSLVPPARFQDRLQDGLQERLEERLEDTHEDQPVATAPPSLSSHGSPSGLPFRNCRNRLLSGLLVLDLDQLARAAADRLAAMGLRDLRLSVVALASGRHGIELGAICQHEIDKAEIVLSFALQADEVRPWQVRVIPASVRIDGPLPVSRTQLVSDVLNALAPSPDKAFDPAGEAAFASFTDSGWRAPSLKGLRFVEATSVDGRKLALRFDGHPKTTAAVNLSPRKVLIASAEAAMALGDLDGAERALTQAAVPRPEDEASDGADRAAALVSLARVHEKRGRFEAAQRAAAAAVALAPGYAPALASLGEVDERLGDNAGAYAAYAALAQVPGVRQMMTAGGLAMRQGTVAMALGLWEEAGEHFTRAVKHNPQDPEARHGLAEIALRRRDFPEAARQLEEELRLLPLDEPDRLAQVRHRLGDALVRLGDWGGARYHLELVVSQDPQRIEAWEMLADVTARLGLPEQTAVAFERLSRIYASAEKRAEALFRRGEVLRDKLEDRAGALDAYLKASDLCPSHAGTAARLVDAFWRLGDYESLAGLSSDLFAGGQIDASPPIRLRLILGMALARRDSSPVADEALANLPWDPADVTEAMIEAAENLAEGPVDGLDPLLTSLLRWRGPLAEHSLREGLKATWRHDPGRPGTLRALAWLADRSGDEPSARALYSLVAFLEPQTPPALAERLAALGAAPSPRPHALDLGGPADHADCIGRCLPLRGALARLASPLQGFAQGPMGIAPPDDQGVPRDRNVLARRLARLLGVPPVRFVVTPSPPGRPPRLGVGFEPTRPATLRIARETLAVNDGELTFLLARALDLARNGLGSLGDRPAEDIAAFLLGALAAHNQQPGPDQPLVKAAETWFSQPEQSEGLQAGGDSVAIRDELSAAPEGLATWDAFLRGAEQASNRFALLACRSPLEALRALARLEGAGQSDFESLPREKRQALLRTAPLRGLAEFMLSPAYEACLDVRAT